jgi:alkanesulfonate monooxygenase SsuD/methylene tetrahydromethanopterin reductase-like flavin-dependent oxidoreductase (luciferase family)
VKFSLLYEIQKQKPWTETSNEDVYHEALEQIVHADNHGWDRVWVVEHHFLPEFSHSSRSEIFLGGVATRTKNIRIGHGVVLLPFQHPIKVAEGIAVLDILSKGRVEFGTGRGLSPLEMSGFGISPNDTRAMWEESLSIVPRMWKEDIFSHEGTYWKIPPRSIMPKPVQKPHPPIWMAGNQPDSFKIAGRKGLGMLALSIGEPTRLGAAFNMYREALKGAEPVGDFINNQCAAFTLGLCGDDNAESRRLAADAAKWYYGLNREFSRDFASDWGSADNAPESYRYYARLKEKGIDIKSTIYDLTPDDMADRAMLVSGDPESCIRSVKCYEETGADELIICMQMGRIPHEKIMRSIELFSKEVMPKFR